MNKKITALLFLVVLLSAKMTSQQIQVKKINSRELGTERILKIYVPPSYNEDNTKLYPITVVLDAEYLFDVYVGNAILFANIDEAPEQIIVGIYQNQFNERFEDCSFQKENSLPTDRGAAFYRFIRSELATYMESNYRISPFKTIIGNTLTANFLNYFLIEDHPGFNAFIAINPYLGLDIPTMLDQKVKTLKDENIYYYLSNGSYNTEKYAAEINNAHQLLSKSNNPKFKYKYQNIDGATKTSSIGVSISNALAFIFELYSAISTEEFEKNIKNLSPADAIAYLENKYVEIDYLFGSNLKIREKDIFAIESIVMDKENGDYLKDFGEMINKLYKESPIGDYYIGRYYETGNKLKQALNYYKSGYMKLPEGDPNADGYYENIDRIILKQSGLYVEPEQKKEN
ncbi:alpha/beta hydrolase [Lutibacter sp.]|uniref:alpha/beta hydrolase n=1 Tax=Lutibacter sp. TaxID=1925666 RepID=UPI002732FCFB|nr:alpha/beta hydrolase-fold protein [Lutibacter sp.]MDP3312498.1 alpha/beta hydrolase-fold protein [Lutibacter sp.]